LNYNELNGDNGELVVKFCAGREMLSGEKHRRDLVNLSSSWKKTFRFIPLSWL